MRKYIVEKIGIVEIFQIIVAVVILTLGCHAFTTDMRWNNAVDEMGINVCVKINQELCHINKTVMYLSECPRLQNADKIDHKTCGPKVARAYLAKTDRPTILKNEKGQEKDISNFIQANMKRDQVTEIGFITLLSLICFSLPFHLVMTSLSNNVELRTKWNASLQGIILFSSGYAAVLMAISTNSIDTKDDTVSKHLQPCALLRYCDRLDSNLGMDLDINAQIIITNVLHNNNACQGVNVKKGVTILLLMLICMCVAMILLAMELTTKYEEELDEETETRLREAIQGVDTLIEDQTVVFESRAEDEVVATHPSTLPFQIQSDSTAKVL